MDQRHRTAGLIFAVHGADHRDRIVQLLHSVEANFLVHHFTEGGEPQGFSAGLDPTHVDLLLIGERVSTPIQVAQRLRHIASSSEVLFVVSEERLTHFRGMLPFIPELAEARAESSAASDEQFLEVVRTSVQAARQRRRVGGIHSRINEMLENRGQFDAAHRTRSVTDAYLSSVLSQAGDPIFVLAGDGTLIAWNNAAANLFGRPMGAGEPFSLLQYAVGKDRGCLEQVLRRAAEGEAIGRHLACLQDAAGEARDLELNLTRLIDPTHQKAAISCVCRDVTEHLRTQNQLRTAVAEKEVLIREVHHRVKNNLQLIMSMLQLQARSLSEADREPLLNITRRVSAIARVHDRLSGADRLTSIDCQLFVQDLCADLVSSFNVEQRIAFHSDLTSINLDLEDATPVALILVELITNAFKHAFPGDRSGVISISGRETSEFRELTVSDNGVGAPAGHTARPGSLGHRMVAVLTQQIQGRLSIQSNAGTTVVLQFPKA